MLDSVQSTATETECNAAAALHSFKECVVVFHWRGGSCHLEIKSYGIVNKAYGIFWL